MKIISSIANFARSIYNAVYLFLNEPDNTIHIIYSVQTDFDTYLVRGTLTSKKVEIWLNFFHELSKYLQSRFNL